jgi:glycogen(starch) synthase
MNYTILIVSREYPPSVGGIASLNSILASALAQRGHDVHVLSCLKDQPLSDTFDAGHWVHRRPETPVRGLRRVLKGPMTLERIESSYSAWREHLRLGIRFDVVQAGNYFAEGLFFGLLRTEPLVVWLYTHTFVNAIESRWRLDDDVRWMDKLERLTARRADVVCTGSRYHLDGVKKTGWLRHALTGVVAPPVDVSMWKDVPPVQATAPVVLQVGRLEARKRPEVALEAFLRVAPRIADAKIIFAGRTVDGVDGVPYEEWLIRRGREANCYVEVLGEVTIERLRQLYAEARVCTVPSSHESFGLVVAQAMAAGRPVITTDSVGASELLLDGKAGRVVPTQDVDAFAAALAPYLEDPALAERAGAHGRTIARSELEPAVVATRMEPFYAKAIDRWAARTTSQRAARAVGRIVARRGIPWPGDRTSD